MLKVAVLDDYQNVFSQIINLDEYKSKYEFTIFNEPFQNELETIEALKRFEALFIMRERTKITKNLISNLPKLKFIMTSGTRNKAIYLSAAKEKKNISLWYRDKSKSSCRSNLGFNTWINEKLKTRN